MFKRVQVLVLILALLWLPGSYLQGQSANPELRVLVDKVVEQLNVAVQETIFAVLSAELGELKQRAQRALNVLVGKESPDYVAAAGNPGDGIGAIKYAQQLLRKIRESSLARDLVFAADTIVFDIVMAIERAKGAIKAPNLSQSRSEVRRGFAFLLAARGCKDDPVGEGGARAIQAKLER